MGALGLQLLTEDKNSLVAWNSSIVVLTVLFYLYLIIYFYVTRVCVSFRAVFHSVYLFCLFLFLFKQ